MLPPNGPDASGLTQGARQAYPLCTGRAAGKSRARTGFGNVMPEISRFYGIVIAMYHQEHNPPHFHARYGGDKAAVEINSLEVLEGKLPRRALGLVVEWASQHQDELARDWELAHSGRPPQKIEPLK